MSLNHKMKWIGLTGGIASGKSSVATLLKSRGIPVVDADELSREAVAPGSDGLKSVVKKFGAKVLDKKGTLDRAALGEIIFSDDSSRELLEQIIHPIVRKMAEEKRRELEQQGEVMAFYDVPLLFEKKMEDLFDHVVLVVSSPENQKMRLMKRNNLNSAQAEARLKSQMKMEAKRAGADFIIENDGKAEDLDSQIKDLIEKLR